MTGGIKGLTQGLILTRLDVGQGWDGPDRLCEQVFAEQTGGVGPE